MHEFFDLSQYVYMREQQHKQEQERKQLHVTYVERLQKSALMEIRYPMLSEAYDYVHSLFPGANVKSVTIFKCPVPLMEKYGFEGVEGFYSILLKTIIIAGKRKKEGRPGPFCVRAKIQQDEAIVHELLHYAYAAEGRTSVSSEMREEFAYGYSVGYLRGRYTDEEIIEFNFLPYLFSCYVFCTNRPLL